MFLRALICKIAVALTTILELTAFRVVEIGKAKNFGAEVLDVNLASISNEEFAELEQYLHSYKVLVFRNQSNLTVEVSKFILIF